MRLERIGTACLFAAMLYVHTVAGQGLGASARAAGAGNVERRTESDWQAPILVYHRFEDEGTSSMVVRPSTFTRQLAWLRERRCEVIPLARLVASLRRKLPPPPPRAIAITVDDGRRSVLTGMLPAIAAAQVPVTLFVYPSAISNASYALTWSDLERLYRSGVVDVQSHTWWHPNFRTEAARLPPQAYRSLAVVQLARSKSLLEQRLGVTVTLVAWPFGIYDPELGRLARESGYVAGFGLERRPASSGDDIMALPRFLVTEASWRETFQAICPEDS